MKKKILPYSRQSISSGDIASVNKILISDFLTTGPTVKKFEIEISRFCKSKYSILVNSGTSALHIACLALNVKKNDIVWTSPITFAASANCALYCGAKVDFVDIDPETFNMSSTLLEEKLVQAKKNKKLPKLVIPVHLAGQSCDMQKIMKLSQKYGFKIIEDASHAFGGVYKKTKVGSCKYSHITVSSFHPVKIITSGEGGVAITNSKSLALQMQSLREHGIERDKKKFLGKSHGSWFYQQKFLGYNYRMSDIHAALGISQLTRIRKFTKERNLIANYYKKKLIGLPIDFQKGQKDIYSTFHLFIILVSKNIHKKLFDFLRKNNIFVNIHYIPVHLHPYYKSLGFQNSQFRNSINYYNRAISSPIYYNLKKKDQNNVINLIKKFFKIYSLKKY